MACHGDREDVAGVTLLQPQTQHPRACGTVQTVAGQDYYEAGDVGELGRTYRRSSPRRTEPLRPLGRAGNLLLSPLGVLNQHLRHELDECGNGADTDEHVPGCPGNPQALSRPSFLEAAAGHGSESVRNPLRPLGLS